MEESKETRSRNERLSRLIEILKAEAESRSEAAPNAAAAARGFRYPRNRWSAPAE